MRTAEHEATANVAVQLVHGNRHRHQGIRLARSALQAVANGLHVAAMPTEAAFERQYDYQIARELRFARIAEVIDELV